MLYCCKATAAVTALVQGRIRVELHVSRLSHTLSGVHLLDAGAQVVPYLVQANLLQAMRVLTTVGRHDALSVSAYLMSFFSLILLSLYVLRLSLAVSTGEA